MENALTSAHQQSAEYFTTSERLSRLKNKNKDKNKNQ